MSTKTPTPADRMVSHVLVGAVVSWVFSKITGFLGWLIAGLVGGWLHAKLDAPLATVIAASA
jgi:uncharacterized membrane protein